MCAACSAEVTKRWRDGKGWQRAKLWNTWSGMLRRCNDRETDRWANAKTIPIYRDYGYQGIKVCEGWSDPVTGFDAFVCDMGPPPSKAHTLDRIRNDRGYNCGRCADCRKRRIRRGNCRWATKEEQDANRKNSRFLTATDPSTCEELTLTMGAWARRLGIRRQTISDRLSRGWDVERALFTPTAVQPGVPF